MTVDLDLESFARVQARIRRPFAERDDVLQSAGLSEPAFRNARAHWHAELSGRDAEPLRERYRAAFADADAAMSAAPVAATAEAPASERAALATPEAASEPEPGVKFIPSYMLSAASSSAPPPAPLRGAAPPLFVFPATAPQATETPRPSAAARMGSTAPIDFERLRKIVLADPTPFLGKTSPERLKELRATTAATSTNEASTDEHDRLRRLASGAGDTNETAMLVPSSSSRVGNLTLPFAAKGAKVIYPEMSVDRYAAFAAELHSKGASVEILDRYDVTSSAALVALHGEQERRMAADPTVRARFEERKAHFVRFMKLSR